MNNKDLLKELEPELLKLLINPPKYGSVTVSLTFHDSKVKRIETAFSLLRKPEGSKDD